VLTESAEYHHNCVAGSVSYDVPVWPYITWQDQSDRTSWYAKSEISGYMKTRQSGFETSRKVQRDTELNSGITWTFRVRHEEENLLLPATVLQKPELIGQWVFMQTLPKYSALFSRLSEESIRKTPRWITVSRCGNQTVAQNMYWTFFSNLSMSVCFIGTYRRMNDHIFFSFYSIAVGVGVSIGPADLRIK